MATRDGAGWVCRHLAVHTMKHPQILRPRSGTMRFRHEGKREEGDAVSSGRTFGTSCVSLRALGPFFSTLYFAYTCFLFPHLECVTTLVNRLKATYDRSFMFLREHCKRESIVGLCINFGICTVFRYDLWYHWIHVFVHGLSEQYHL